MLYDCYVFMPQQTPATLAIRRQYLAEWESRPPEVFVASDQLCLNGAAGFEKLQSWPEFYGFLQQQYTLAEERTPPARVRWWTRPRPPRSYRIYLRKKN
jgi:hypothetical protein